MTDAEKKILEEHGLSTEPVRSAAKAQTEEEILSEFGLNKPHKMTREEWRALPWYEALFTQRPDQQGSGVPFMEGSRTASGLIRSALRGEKVNLKNARTADSFVERNVKQGGSAYNPVWWIADAATDPMNALLMGGAKPSMPGHMANNLWEAVSTRSPELLKQLPKAAAKDAFVVGQETVPFFNPISNVIKRVGTRATTLPFLKADAKIKNYTDHAKFSERPFSDPYLESAPDKVFKSNSTIRDEIDDLRREAYEPLAQAKAVIPEIDLSPLLTEEVRQASAAAQNKQVRDYMQAVLASSEPPKTNPHSLTMDLDTPKPTAPPKPPTGDEIETAGRLAEDAHRANVMETILADLTSNRPNARKAAAEKLKAYAPLMGPAIDEALDNYAIGQSLAATDALKKVVNDALYGPRDAETFSKLATAYGNVAAGSEPMRTSMFQVGSKSNPKQVLAAKTRKTLADVVNEKYAEAIESATPGNGAAALEDFVQAKRKYGGIARTMPEAVKKVVQAIGRPHMTKADMAFVGAMGLGGWGAANDKVDARLLGALALGKFGQGMYQSPAFANMVGRSTHRLGRTGLWDAIARESLIQNATRRDE